MHGLVAPTGGLLEFGEFAQVPRRLRHRQAHIRPRVLGECLEAVARLVDAGGDVERFSQRFDKRQRLAAHQRMVADGGRRLVVNQRK